MNVWARIIIKAIATTASLNAAILFMLPIEFRRLKDNKSLGIRIGWSNLLCKIPTPNMDVSDRELYRFWRLPKPVQMSERMINVGRCAVAVAKFNEKSSSKIETSVCYCINNWWVPTMTIVASMIAFISIVDLISQMVHKHRPFTREEFRREARCEMMRTIFSGIVLVACISNMGNEFSYTQYGDLYPTNHLNVQPMQWMVAFWLFFVGMLTHTIGFYATVCCRKEPDVKQSSVKKEVKAVEKKKTAAEVKYQPPKSRIVVETECPKSSGQVNESFARPSKKPCGQVMMESLGPVSPIKKSEPPPLSPPPSWSPPSWPSPLPSPSMVTAYECVSIVENSDSETDSIIIPSTMSVGKENENEAAPVLISIEPINENQVKKEKSIAIEAEKDEKKEEGDVKKDG